VARKRPSRRRSGRRTVGRALIFALAALVALALAAVGWLGIVYPRGEGPGRGRPVSVTVERGMSIDTLAHRLHDAGAIEDPMLFAMYARMVGADHHLREGETLLSDDMTPRDVLSRVAIGVGAATVRVTIPEGFDRFGVAARLARWGVCSEEDFLAASTDPELLRSLDIPGDSAEGYLFPDTYQLPTDLGGAEAVRRLVAQHERRTAPIYEERARALADLERTLGWSEHQTLILASIIEKEAAVEEERATIARVFLNRLRLPGFSPRRLQADPTVSYGCRAFRDAAPSCAGFDRTITRAMLGDRANPYNTYRHEGLPPGPICNPGVASIRAVLADQTHEYLYFVARGHGRHTFSATLEEHNAAVARLRERE
jgi:UPF0755 protein